MIIARNNGVVTLGRHEMEQLELMTCRNIYMACKDFHECDSCIFNIVPIGCIIGEPDKNWKGWEEV